MRGRDAACVTCGLWLRLLVLLGCTGLAPSVYADILDPAPGSDLASSSVTFSWAAEPGATRYYLGVGTSHAAVSATPWGDVSLQAAGSALSADVFEIPLDGNTIHVRLWYVTASGFNVRDYTYGTVSGTQDQSAAMASPLPPVLLTPNVLMQWDPGQGVSQYMLAVGTSQAAISESPWADLFVYYGKDTSVSVPTILTDGSPVYVRLWSKKLNGWFFEDYAYQSASLMPARLTSPTPATVFQNTSVEFSWDTGSGGTQFVLALATSPALLEAAPFGDIHVSSGTDTSKTVFNIPLDGQDVFVRLWSKIEGNWQYADYQYATQNVVPAALLSPALANPLSKHAQKFQWDAGSGATEYLLGVATDPLLLSDDPYGDIFVASGTSLDAVATGIPLDGSDLYVRLWSLINGEWFYRDSVYSSEFSSEPPDPVQECAERGWQTVSTQIGGLTRELLWRGPTGSWGKGAIILLHGGGGTSSNWCHDMPATHPQLTFSEQAVQQGYAVLALNSTDGVLLDAWGRNCGKRFDAFTPGIDNIDLPYIDRVLSTILPALRPAGSSANIFVSGISNGGFMTTRAATRFDDQVSAFAPVASGDPYGTYLYCDESLSTRPEAPGMFLDKETNLGISVMHACLAAVYPDEEPWETNDPADKPPFLLAYHQGDDVVNSSCMEKVNAQLLDHGYPDSGALILSDGGQPSEEAHYWQPEYNQAILDFFSSFTP